MAYHLLRLFVAGQTSISHQAKQNLARLMAAVHGEVKAEVVDVLKDPELAEKAAVIATPTLSYERPDRIRRVVGDLSDLSDLPRIIGFLGLESETVDEP